MLQFVGFTLVAALRQRVETALIGGGHGDREAFGNQVVAGVAGRNTDFVRFGAEVFNWFDENDVCLCHN